MNNGRFLFLGIFGTFALGWLCMAVIPQTQMGTLQPQVNEEAGEVYPVNVAGLAAQGRQVYAANGCNYCHSQQIRSRHTSADIDRGWGARRTVARDYIYETPAFIGTMRNGPDLANIGQRQKSREWHYQHLYDPRSLVPNSIMPPFRFLFEKRKIVGERSADALNLTGENAVEEGYEVVPGSDAKALVGYLLSLDRSHGLKEAAVTEAAK
jgi:cytochrome c oxidase cbb3-type subunit II